MKMKKYLLMLALFVSAFTLQSCDDDDNITVSSELTTALAELYPNATNVRWEMELGYYVADFWENNIEKEAWFTTSGTWDHTEWDILASALPTAVTTAIQTKYPGYVIDDVDYIEMPNDGDYYYVEIESGATDIYVAVYADGTFL